MRQTLLMLTIASAITAAIATPLAMAQDADATTAAVTTTPAAQTSAALDAPARPQPASVIGRALAGLLRDGNRQPATTVVDGHDAALDASALDPVHRASDAPQDGQAIP